MRVHFESTPLGEYGGQKRDADWASQTGWSTSGGSKDLSVVDLGGNRVLQVINRAGEVHSSGNFKVYFPRSYEALYMSFRVMYHRDFFFTLGGKLPRLQGGTYKACVPPTEGFSAAVSWNAWDFKDPTHGWIKPYVYHLDQPGDCGQGSTASDAKIEPGRWYTVQTFTEMNTVGQADGVMKIWVDGRLVYQRSSYRFRDDAALAIERFQFLHGFGGKDTDEFRATKDETTYFDDFVISTQPITTGNADAGVGADSGPAADSGSSPDASAQADSGGPAEGGERADGGVPAADSGTLRDSAPPRPPGGDSRVGLQPTLEGGGCSAGGTSREAPLALLLGFALLAACRPGRRRR